MATLRDKLHRLRRWWNETPEPRRPADPWASGFLDQVGLGADATHAATPTLPPWRTWDASQIKPPGWDHVFAAFVAGAREARANPEAMDSDFRRAADGYTKLVFEEVDPVSEAALRTESWRAPALLKQEPLGEAFQQVLLDNLESLYEVAGDVQEDGDAEARA